MSGGGSVYTFLGKEDPGVGMLDFGPRYYQATLGRFLSPDPALAGPSPYSYAEGNPVMLYDPTGMYCIPPPPPEPDIPDVYDMMGPDTQPGQGFQLGLGTYLVDGEYVQIGYTSEDQAADDLPTGSDARDAYERKQNINQIWADAVERRRQSELTANTLMAQAAKQRQQQQEKNKQKEETGAIASTDCLKEVEIDGVTWLFDAAIADNVAGFIKAAREAGYDVHIISAFRTTSKQGSMKEESAAPEGTSFHEAGFAFDLGGDDRYSSGVREIACEWGFQNEPGYNNLNHYIADPGEFGYAGINTYPTIQGLSARHDALREARSRAIRHNQRDYNRRFR